MSVKNVLMDHQRVHSWKLQKNPYNGLAVFDDVGTGKTISALNIISNILGAIKELNKELTHPILIVVPPALIEKWTGECQKWCNISPKHAKYHRGALTLHPGVNILSHGSLEGPPPTNIDRIGVLIVDEVHHFRNQETQSSKILHKFCLSSEYRVLLTATPLQNSRDDLISILQYVLPHCRRTTVETLVTEAISMKNPSLLRPLITRCAIKTNDANRKITDHDVEMSEREFEFCRNFFDSKTSKSLSDIVLMKMAASSFVSVPKTHWAHIGITR
ncbi:MAG: SNF2-related protein [Candidatus Poseidoniales archaeon]